jgi:DNA topoisomerase I
MAGLATDDPTRGARMPRLRRADCSGPGIRRRRRGKGFEYRHPDGAKVTEPETLDRLRALAIPPAWEDVWICPHPNGHLQAVGTDAAGRRQYRYHERWRERRDIEKFDRMLDFARRLPTLRERCREALDAEGMGRERVLACAARMLDLGFFRIGTESYAEEHETYGLTTMHRSHVALDGDVLEFDYPAKGGKQRVQSIVDPQVREVVSVLKRRRHPDPQLLAYKEAGRWVDVTSRDVNDYLKAVCGREASAKDFRTWNATVLAAVGVAVSAPASRSKTAGKRAITRATKEVAHYLGNTPAVCRKSYIDPRVFDRYLSGWTIAGALDRLGADAEFGGLSTQGVVEEAVLDLLEYRRASDALVPVGAGY